MSCAQHIIGIFTMTINAVGPINREQVSRELDSLKRRGGEVEVAARLATKWLLQAIQAGQPSGLLRAQVRTVKAHSFQVIAHHHCHRLKGSVQQMYHSRMQMMLVGLPIFTSISQFSPLISF